MTDIYIETANLQEAIGSLRPFTPAVIHAAAGPTVNDCLDTTRDHYIIHNSCESIAWDIENDLLRFPELRSAIATAACEASCLPPSRFWLDAGQRLLLAALQTGELPRAQRALEELERVARGTFSRTIVNVAIGGLQQILLLSEAASDAAERELPVISVDEFLQKRTRLYLLNSGDERQWSKAFSLFLTVYICRALDAAQAGEAHAEIAVIVEQGLTVVPSFVYRRLYAEGPKAGIKIFVTNE